MQHSSSVGVVHAESMTPNGQALPQHRLRLQQKALPLQGEGHLLQSVSHLGMVQSQGSLLNC